MVALDVVARIVIVVVGVAVGGGGSAKRTLMVDNTSGAHLHINHHTNRSRRGALDTHTKCCFSGRISVNNNYRLAA